VKKWIFNIALLASLQGLGQDSTSVEATTARRDSPVVTNRIFQKRQWLIGGGTTAIYAGMFAGLNESWYKGYPRSSFHTFNDAGEWLQMDKVGHAWTVYTASNLSYGMYRWAGMKNNKAVWLSSVSGLAYMLSIEYLDGRSAEWGWSWADAGADAFGALLFATQQLGWKEQKIQLKFSSHRINYAADTRQRADDLFGSALSTRILKDYNAQAYWLSFHFPPSWKLPRWLQVSAGYGASGMLGGYENVAYDKNGAVIFNRPDIRRYRQWYIAPDVDLTRIPTKSKLLKTVFYTLNSLKFPAPALELSHGRLRGHFLYF
jgi:hypothetical protein